MPGITMDVIYSQSKTRFWCTAVNVLSFLRQPAGRLLQRQEKVVFFVIN